MKKNVAALAAAALSGMVISFAGASPSSAATEDAKCYEQVIDKEAYDETVVVTPAVDPVPEVPGVPAIEEVSHIVKHPAETKVVRHEAETHTEYHFAKFTRERTKKGNDPWSDYGSWSKYSPETHTSWETSDAPLGSPEFHSSGTRPGGIKWERQWQAMFDGQTKTVEDKPAYDETVTVKEAWDEKVVTQEYVPAVPPVPAIPGVPAVTKIVHHDATYKDVEVDCGLSTPPITIPKPGVEKPTPDNVKRISTPASLDKKTPATPTPTENAVLPNTGGPKAIWFLGGLVLSIIGTTLVLRARKE